MASIVKIAIAQINCVVGDLAGNANKILGYCEQARTAGADVMLTPELALCGYPPEDLLLRGGFYRDCNAALERLAREVRGITLVVGHPHEDQGKRHNAASVVKDGRIVGTYYKHVLPNYTVFDEERYFVPGDLPCVFQEGETRFGVNICEDTWGPQGPLTTRPDAVSIGINICADAWGAKAPQAAREAGAQVLLVLNASPYHMRKQESRHDVMRERVIETGMALVYANMVGGQDELVFDGASFALDRRGEVVCQLPVFEAFLALLAKEFARLRVDATEENLQARIRGTLLMALSNKFGAIVLTTGNKSEMAVGYATLYGDMAGGFAVIKDILKTLVYRLCRHRNGMDRVIPERVLTRAPSAELKANQTDQDSLPPYDVLDAIVSAYMENDLSPAEMVARGFRTEDVRRVVEMIHRSEYKRRQAPIGIRITHRGFGKDRRYPITPRYRKRYEQPLM